MIPHIPSFSKSVFPLTYASLTNGQIVVCRVTLWRKEIQEWGREDRWVSRSLMTARKIALVRWICTWKKTVANDRAGIKRLAWSFEDQWVKEEWMMKEWMMKESLAQKLNVLISSCDGLLLLLELSRTVSAEERTREQYTAFYIARRGHLGRMVSVILIGRNI